MSGHAVDWDDPDWGKPGKNRHEAASDDLGKHGKHSDETDEA